MNERALGSAGSRVASIKCQYRKIDVREFLITENNAVLRLQSQRYRTANPAGWGQLNLRALIYLDREPGLTNIDNLIASVMDALQKAEVVPDDCHIRGLDGCRIRLDRKNPRVEITLSPLEEP